jgi:DHA3 family tetracycline resistance protein-like MFS transporter
MTAAAAGPRHQRASLLRDGSFVRLCAGQAISAVGDKLSSMAVVVWILTQRDDGPLALGAVFAVRVLATSLLVMVGGVLADRLPARQQTIASQLGLAVTVGALAVIPANAPLSLILVLFAAAGVADALFEPASRMLVFDLAGPDRLGAANSVSAVTLRAAGLLGPALGGALVAIVGIKPTLLLDAASFLVAALAVASTRTVVRRGRARAGGSTILGEAKAGLAFAARTRWLRAVLLSDLCQTFFAVAPWFVLLPIALIPRSPTAYAIAITAFAAGGVLGSAVPLRWKPRAIGRAALLSQVLFALPLVALALDLPLEVIAGACVIGGFGADLGSVLFMTGLQRGVPTGFLGRVTALSSLGSVALVPAGFAVAGALVSTVGIRSMLLLGAAVILFASGLALRIPGVEYMGAGAAAGRPSSGGRR